MDEALPLSVGVRERDRDTVVSVAGELDYGTTPQLLAVAEPLAARGGALVLDLADLTFCDSSALSALVRLHKASRVAGGSLSLAALRSQVRAAITMTSLDQLLTIVDEVPAGPDGHPRP
ncbi:STAS domain-containing protein [Saccharothrix syringae]|uniref:Anti-sigma factor antagonist n=1 Tax=Saccharothrix syringae TaxID=103733 RepID=A0A5Q0H7C0_SACSY|nr:STAS domain-containing protein [Saccharothrix syringae]QFZ21602.1 anti-sigma factor antagonist [Saccharothrix syringae]